MKKKSAQPYSVFESMSGRMGRLSRSKESKVPGRMSSLAEQKMSESKEVLLMLIIELLRSFTKSVVLAVSSSRFGPERVKMVLIF